MNNIPCAKPFIPYPTKKRKKYSLIPKKVEGPIKTFEILKKIKQRRRNTLLGATFIIRPTTVELITLKNAGMARTFPIISLCILLSLSTRTVDKKAYLKFTQ